MSGSEGLAPTHASSRDEETAHSSSGSGQPSAPEHPPSTIAIVGAGFSGTLVAINLLRAVRGRPLRVVLIDRAPVGHGLAYARRSSRFLLNVPARRMSANSTNPVEFLEFAQRWLPGAEAEDFLARELYGEYLKWSLARAEVTAPPRVQLSCMRGTAVAIDRPPESTEIYVRLADGRRVVADTVVLALGNPPPARIGASEPVRGSSRYVEDPWAVTPEFHPGERVVIIGTGLTMADVALAGHESAGGRAVIYAISRHGLIPQPQTAFRDATEDAARASLLQQTPQTTRQILFTVRALCEEAQRSGRDWREVIALVRGLVPTLWRCLPTSERRRFLRHVRIYWDVHRHRLPPQVWNSVDELRKNGTLHVHAGQLVAMQLAGKRIRVIWRARGAGQVTALLADRVINCTGPDYDVSSTQDRLLRSLLLRGMAVPDSLGLGLAMDEYGALKGEHGVRTGDLYYLGPMLRAEYWEATTVQELRVHAERLAGHLATSLNS